MNTIELQIENVVDTILSDYSLGRDVDKIDLHRHPDKAVITDMIQKLLRIVYPGYSRDKSYRIYNVKHNLSMLIEDVMFNLNRQIILVLQDTGMTQEEAEEKSQELCLEFFRQIPQLRCGQRLSVGISQLTGKQQEAPFQGIQRNLLLGAGAAFTSSSES